MKDIINQIVEMENKAKEHDLAQFSRNFKRLHNEFENMGFKIVNPLGQAYDARDTSLEANLSNEQSDKIVKVLKPVIYKSENDNYLLIQKGIVIVD